MATVWFCLLTFMIVAYVVLDGFDLGVGALHRILARGEEQLAANRQSVVNELRGQLGALAVELAGKVVGESLADEARRRGTVDRFLDQLDVMTASDGHGGSTVAAQDR